jgi:tetratricopeptide (TPR) repeat protein
MFSICRYKILTCFIACFLPILSYPQEETTDAKQLFVEAESYFLFEEYKDALPLYQKILRAEPDNYNVIYKIGMCYLNDIYQKQKSIKYLEQAVEQINPNYKQNNYREKQAPPEAYYYLGKAYQENNMLDKAIDNYQHFRKLADPAAYDLEIVDEDIASCQLAKKLMPAPVYFKAKDLGEPVDTRYEEMNPVISGDGKSLAFTRKLPFYDAVFLSVKSENGTWSEPVNLTADFGLDGSSYTTGISFAGDEIFVYRSDNFDGNIYSSQLKNNQWSKLVKLNDNINTKYWESHASPSFDGQYLIFTSNRQGGYGGLDIYKSKRGAKGDWGPAVNMGPVINSPGNEETPFLSNDGYTLFFSSQGHKTLGGYDIFISNLQSNGTWSIPKNMGYPINTTDDNIFYCPTGNNAFGLYALYREDSSEGLLDIYSIEVYNEMIPRTFTVKGIVKAPGINGDILHALKARLYDANTKEIIMETDISDEGIFTMKPVQGSYMLTIEGPGIETYRKDINLAVNQTESLIDIPSITVTTSGQVAEPIVAITPSKSKIAARTDHITVTGAETVPVGLTLVKGSDIHVDIFVNDSLNANEDISDVKKKFTYFYKPKPGENRLRFTATDPDGNISSTEVIISCYPAEIPPMTENRVEINANPDVNTNVLSMIATGALSNYLKKPDVLVFKNYTELYQHLLDVSDKEGFTESEIQQLFSVFFTQKNSEAFSRELSPPETDTDSLWKHCADSSKIPLEFLNKLIETKLVSTVELTDLLLKLLEKDGVSGKKLFTNLITFSGSGAIHTETETKGITVRQAWELFDSEQDDRKAGSALKLTATSDDFDFFYQSLLLASDSSLFDYLVRLQPEPQGITTSVGLVEFLFHNASDSTYRTAKLIQALQKGSMNRYYYLDQFTNLLTDNATGSLKSELLQIKTAKEKPYHTFEGLLEYILNQAKYKNYKRESVYDLILSLIGINNVDEFAEKIRSYGYRNINRAIDDTTMSYFSNPMELIQYLLMATQIYDFSETDINNLLIRMILEKGLHERSRDLLNETHHEFWKNKKSVPTIILVNIVIIILIVLFVFRRRKKN